MINYISNGKAIIIRLIDGLIKKILYKMSCFPEPYKIKVGFYLSNYATKYWFKKCNRCRYIKRGKEVDLASLKSDINKLDSIKLETTPVHFSNLGGVVKNEVVKKTVCDELVKKLNAIQTIDASDLVKKLTITQKLIKLKLKYLTMINIWLLKILIS